MNNELNALISRRETKPPREHLQEKCLIGSIVGHGLLLLIVLTVPAFMSQREETPAQGIMTVHSAAELDSLLAEAIPTPAPPPIQPPPPAKPVRPEIRFDQAKTKTFQTPRQPQKPARPASDLNRTAQELRNLSQSSRERLSENLSTSTDIQVPLGTSANYAGRVKQAFDRAWQVNSSIRQESGEATVEITVRQDGTVTHTRIVRSDESALLDASVRAALNKVTLIAPFPPDDNDREKTFRIVFNLSTR